MVTGRVTESDLYQLTSLINQALGIVPDIEPIRDQSYFLDFANGGVRLVRAGGSVDVSPRLTKRELEQWMRAFHAGIVLGKEVGPDA